MAAEDGEAAGDDGPPMITTEVMLERMRDFAQIGVNQITGLMMGGVFAAAAVTFMEILRSPDGRAVRITGWLYGVTAAISWLDSVLRRTLIDARPKLWTVPMVGAAGLLSMMGFALLGPTTGGPDGWRYAQLVMFVAGVTLSGVISGPLADRVEPALQPFYDRLAARAHSRGKIGWPSILLSALPFSMAMIDKYAGVPLQPAVATFNLLLSAFAVGMVITSQRHYGRFYEEIYALHTAKLKAAQEPIRPLRKTKLIADKSN